MMRKHGKPSFKFPKKEKSVYKVIGDVSDGNCCVFYTVYYSGPILFVPESHRNAHLFFLHFLCPRSPTRSDALCWGSF